MGSQVSCDSSGRAIDIATLRKCKHVEFTEVAILTRNLPNRPVKETLRVVGEVVTIGVAAIARGTIGNFEHWAFVAQGPHPSHVSADDSDDSDSDKKVWYVAQFNSGQTINRDFTGIVTESWEEVEKRIQEEDSDEWVERTYGWKELGDSFLLVDLNIFAQLYPYKEYTLHNNCQHFAQWMFEESCQAGKLGQARQMRLDQEAWQRELAEEEVQKRLKKEHEDREEESLKMTRNYPVPAHLKPFCMKYMQDMLEHQQQVHRRNIGLFGNSGAGKSALLGLLLFKFPGSDQPPKRRSSSEGDGTKVPTKYRICLKPQNPWETFLWDNPGQGTDMFPALCYLKDMGFKYYNLVIVTTDGRWTQNDTNLAKAIKDAGTELIVVRTKADQLVDNAWYDEKTPQQQALQQGRSKLASQLSFLQHDRLHQVTNREDRWTDFGSVDGLCVQIRDVTFKTSPIYASRSD